MNNLLGVDVNIIETKVRGWGIDWEKNEHGFGA
jgi:hypothetical protein